MSEVEFIKENFDNMSIAEISRVLGFSRSKITRLAKVEGLIKSEKYIKEKDELEVYLESPLDIYFITNKGRLVNSKTNNVVKSKICSHGYERVTLQVNHIKYDRYIHRLLAIAFIENPLDKPHVNHKDGNKSNNDLSNLEWVTEKENSIHATEILKVNIGENSSKSKITENQALLIKKELFDGLSVAEIVRRYDFATRSIVQKIKYGKTWTHI